MAKLRIHGGTRLSGRIVVEGNKNAALPLIAACLLTDRECVLSNVPRIRDVDVLVELVRGLGATVNGAGAVTSDCFARRNMYPTAGIDEIVPGDVPSISSLRRRWLM